MDNRLLEVIPFSNTDFFFCFGILINDWLLARLSKWLENYKRFENKECLENVTFETFFICLKKGPLKELKAFRHTKRGFLKSFLIIQMPSFLSVSLSQKGPFLRQIIDFTFPFCYGAVRRIVGGFISSYFSPVIEAIICACAYQPGAEPPIGRSVSNKNLASLSSPSFVI